MRIILCLATMAVTFASAALALAATDETPAATTTKTGKAADPRLDLNAVVCKGVDTTGTRLGAKKVCRTRAEWAALAAETRVATDRMQSSFNGATH